MPDKPQPVLIEMVELNKKVFDLPNFRDITDLFALMQSYLTVRDILNLALTDHAGLATYDYLSNRHLYKLLLERDFPMQRIRLAKDEGPTLYQPIYIVLRLQAQQRALAELITDGNAALEKERHSFLNTRWYLTGWILSRAQRMPVYARPFVMLPSYFTVFFESICDPIKAAIKAYRRHKHPQQTLAEKTRALANISTAIAGMPDFTTLPDRAFLEALQALQQRASLHGLRELAASLEVFINHSIHPAYQAVRANVESIEVMSDEDEAEEVAAPHGSLVLHRFGQEVRQAREALRQEALELAPEDTEQHEREVSQRRLRGG